MQGEQLAAFHQFTGNGVMSLDVEQEPAFAEDGRDVDDAEEVKVLLRRYGEPWRGSVVAHTSYRF